MGYINKIKIFGSEVLPPPDIVILSTGRGGGSVLFHGADYYPFPALPPLSRGFSVRHLVFIRVFIPISDLSVTAKTGDVSGDSSSSRGQDTETRDCPRKPQTSGHPTPLSLLWLQKSCSKCAHRTHTRALGHAASESQPLDTQ